MSSINVFTLNGILDERRYNGDILNRSALSDMIKIEINSSISKQKLCINNNPNLTIDIEL